MLLIIKMPGQQVLTRMSITQHNSRASFQYSPCVTVFPHHQRNVSGEELSESLSGEVGTCVSMRSGSPSPPSHQRFSCCFHFDVTMLVLKLQTGRGMCWEVCKMVVGSEGD